MSYDTMISLRLSEDDARIVDAMRASSGLSRSECIRALVRVPDDARRQDVVYVVDGRSLAKISLELIRWGRHYNQAVHALNTIALLVRNRRPPNDAELAQQLDRIEAMLGRVEEGREDVEDALCAIAGSVTVRGR